MIGSLFLSLIQNTAVLLSFSMLYEYYLKREESLERISDKIVAGIVIGGIGLVLMLTTWTLRPGLVFDTRTILLSVSGLFLGPIPTLMAVVFVGVCRVVMGGGGMWMGLSTIVTSGILGVLWGYFRPAWRNRPFSELVILGLMVHLIMLGSTMFLPSEYVGQTIRVIFFPLLLIYLPGTVLFGLLMLSRVASRENKKDLFRTQTELILAKEKAEDGDRLKTAFLHNVSHEIRTPMNAIIGFSDFLMEPDLPCDKRIQYAEVIVQSSRQLLSIIDDIVRISTIETGHETVNESEMHVNMICQLVFDQFAEQSKKEGVDFLFKPGLSDVDSWIVSDEAKVIEILNSLISNAIKFTSLGHVHFGYTLKDGVLEFYVVDTGIGIPEEMKEEIFKRFRQVDSTLCRLFGGAGLGLSICKAYVELLGGSIWVESKLGTGSVFYFTLPYKRPVGRAVVSGSQMRSDGAVAKQKTYTILAAEDEIFNFVLIREVLSPLRVFLLRAVNGAEAVEMVASKGDIDLVLMDLKMPVMDGFEAAKRIKEIRPELPIFALTAYSQEQDKEKAFACGCSDFISKPFNRNELIEKVQHQFLTSTRQ